MLGKPIPGIRSTLSLTASYVARSVTAEAKALASRLINHLNIVSQVNAEGTVFRISSRGQLLFARCVVGNVDIGLVGCKSFPEAMDAMVLNWGRKIYTTNEAGESLSFPVEVIWVKNDYLGNRVTDIDTVKPGDSVSRLPRQKSDLVILVKAETVAQKGIRIGDRWQARLVV